MHPKSLSGRWGVLILEAWSKTILNHESWDITQNRKTEDKTTIVVIIKINRNMTLNYLKGGLN